MAFFDRATKGVEDEAKVTAARNEKASNLIDLLQKRRSAIEEKLDKSRTKKDLVSSLWTVILVIGGLSLMTISVVRLFPEPLQMEWITSGQVIQFVPVMILLSVIMALGLAGILNEDTLGTLLGGIAGYVLSQGVGRAAAREVTRRIAPIQQAPDAAPSEPIQQPAATIRPQPAPAAGG